MDDLLVVCPIHLDAVSINNILVLKCGHGFCEPCLDAIFAHRARTNGITCPTCRKPIKRRDAIALFLASAKPSTQPRLPSPPPVAPSRPSSPDIDIDLIASGAEGSASDLISQLKEKNRSFASENRTLKTRLCNEQRVAEALRLQLINDLEGVRETHAAFSIRYTALQDEFSALRDDDAQHRYTIQNLRAQNGTLETRLVKAEESAARAWKDNEKTREEVMKLLAENQKAAKALEQARKEAQEELQRAKTFREYMERYKRRCELEKKKRKALEIANRRPPPKIEDESLVVVDANAPDALQNVDGPDFGWLDEACEVKGDRLDVSDEETSEGEKESDDELRLNARSDKGKQKAHWRDLNMESVGDWERPLPHDRDDRSLKPLTRFPSDWSLVPEVLAGSSLGVTRKRKQDDSRAGGSKFFKVKMGADTLQGGSAPSSEQKLSGAMSGAKATRRERFPFPLVVDRRGHIRGAVTLGSRQKLNSKN
ncbi:hypothetical protein PAXRUDRAFT_835765 [Paxillus rubicundulus Ve08.2h10]|uniref:RING-type domain-containing protein n=1 Tax=Paxillus rubicundulus Ve08.2h10 TaxID=930991 RepID=A0A0D0DCT6_9AGAM|nr:hypothetical protein PAXRUDRAFT_835765 [Paxillus rubicundulus Ve08.2h10]